jgi:hypothetical protein
VAGQVLTAGSQKLSVTFTPYNTTDYTTATDSVTLVVTRVTPAVTLKPSVTTATWHSTIEFTATLSGAGAEPAGTVYFLDGSTTLGSESLSSAGVATFSTSKLGVGMHSITVKYAGDSDYAAVKSPAVSVHVNKATPQISLKSSATSAKAGNSVKFTVTLTGIGAEPTGMVHFLDGGTELGAATLNASGVATYSTSKLAAGKHAITAAYQGNSDYTAKTSAAVTVAIQ